MREVKGGVLVVSADAEAVREIAGVPNAPPNLPMEWVSGAREAVELLGRSTHGYVLVMVDKQLSDGTPFDVFRFVRRDPDCPFPGIALALIGNSLTEGDIRRSAVSGCVHFLGRPFNPDAVAQALATWPLDRTDFIVSGSYTGPDRRRASRQQMVERRTISGPAEQTVASTSLGFEIKPSTTVFRFRRMPGGEGDLALALRDGLSREAIEPARNHIQHKKEQAIAMLGHTRKRLDDAYAAFASRLDRETLQHLNAVAKEAAALTETRGLLLIGTIVRGLIGYSGGGYRTTPELMAVLRAHLESLKDALAREVVDDGGAFGRDIVARLKSAEHGVEPVESPEPAA